MALIRCTECGKEFSDKAPACPNCGCPTSEIVKTAAPKGNSAEAEKQILALVEQTLEKAREAVSVLALLLDYKNARFADFDPMEEFTLE